MGHPVETLDSLAKSSFEVILAQPHFLRRRFCYISLCLPAFSAQKKKIKNELDHFFNGSLRSKFHNLLQILQNSNFKDFELFSNLV